MLLYLNNLIAKYLNGLTKPLANFINKVLPPVYNLSDEWWEKSVLRYLNNCELEKIENNTAGDYTGMDIASLLRILKNNWNLLSEYYNSYNLDDFSYFGIFSTINKTLCNKMLDIRNKWAHQDLDKNEANNYINILLRFSKLIGANDIIVQQLEVDASIPKKPTKRHRDELIKFMDEKVLLPAELSEKSTDEIIRKVKHTRQILTTLETSDDVENFFWHLMTSARGFDSHKKFKECGLTTFEDVRDEFADLCGMTGNNT